MRSGTASLRISFIALLAGLALGPTQGLASEVVHRLAFPEVRQQYVAVEAEFPVNGEETELVLPSWAPGAYVIRDFAADVDRFEARDQQGRVLAASKTAKDAWTVDTGGIDSMVVRYRVHAAELNPARSWASTDFIVLNGPSIFLYTTTSRDLPQRLRVTVPEGMGQAMTPLPRENGTWRARNYDELVDSPVVVAEADITSFEADGHEYFLAHIGDASLWDTQKAAADLRDIVKATNAFWGSVPLERPYWFFNVLVEKGGGLEHDHGTVMMTSRWQMRDRQDYIQWLSLATHEYFHVWNVRRLRPAALERYDYRREQYTPDLWLAEGLTSYYDDLLPSRAGVVEPAEYLERLAHQFHSLELTPGRQQLSLKDASRDAWIRHYRPDANAINSTISYYIKGAVLGFVLDTRLRSESRERQSLDDILVSLLGADERKAYAEEDFVDALREAAGDEIATWFGTLLDTSVDPDIDEALAWYGLGLDRRPFVGDDASAPGPGGLGINWEKGRPELVVAAVVDGYSAARAGVLPGDEVLGLNGERVTRSNFDRLKLRLREGESVDLLLARQGRLLTLEVRMGAARPTHYDIGLAEDFRRRDLGRMENWLGQELAMPR